MGVQIPLPPLLGIAFISAEGVGKSKGESDIFPLSPVPYLHEQEGDSHQRHHDQ